MQNSFDSQFGSLDELFSDKWNVINNNQPQQQSLDLDFWLTADLPQSSISVKSVNEEETTSNLNLNDHEIKQKKRKTVAEKKERVVLDEEEKRRRNVLASQKFRAEKKKKDNEMLQVNKKLEARIQELEVLLREKDVEINVLRTLILKQ